MEPETTSIYSLPPERLTDILLFLRGQWGDLRRVDSYFKELISSLCVQEAEKTKTKKYIYLSSLSSYEYVLKESKGISCQTIVDSIKNKTLSEDVARLVFTPTSTLVNKDVLFVLGETSSVNYLNILTKNWPFLVKENESQPAKWKKFVLKCLSLYSNDVYEWLLANKTLFIPDCATFEKGVQDIINHNKDMIPCDNVDRIISLSKTFTEFKSFVCIGKMKSVQDLIQLLDSVKFSDLNPATKIKLLREFVDHKGRLSYVADWDKLDDDQKIQQLNVFASDAKILFEKLGTPINLPSTLGKLFYFVYFHENWLRGFQWAHENNYTCRYLKSAKSRKHLTKITPQMLKYCRTINLEIAPTHYIDRIVKTHDIHLFEEYVINNPKMRESWGVDSLRLENIAEHKHLGEWLLTHHLDFFTSSLQTKVAKEFKDIFFNNSFILTGLQRYKAMLYWLNVKSAFEMIAFMFPQQLLYIGIQIAKGVFGDPQEDSDVHKFLIQSFTTKTLVQRNYYFKKIKSWAHLEAALPLLLPYVHDLNFDHLFDMLDTVQKCKDLVEVFGAHGKHLKLGTKCWEMRYNKSDQVQYLLFLINNFPTLQRNYRAVIKALIKWNQFTTDNLKNFFLFPLDTDEFQIISNIIIDYGTKEHLQILNKTNSQTQKPTKRRKIQ